MPPKISVIIPLYNGEHFLEECLASLFKQTLKDIEVICVDDGSTDSTADKLIAWARKEPRMIVRFHTNRGSGPARNAALDIATGQYVCFLDGDDFYPDSGTLERLYEAASATRALLCGGSFERENNGTRETTFTGIYTAYKFEREGWVEYKDYQFDYGYHRFIYSRHMLETHKIRFPSYLRFQDPPFFVNAMIAAGRFYAVKDSVYVYRKGHKAVNWDEPKTRDLVLGLTDNLVAAREANYERLWCLTVDRSTRDFLKVIDQSVKNGSTRLKAIVANLISEIEAGPAKRGWRLSQDDVPKNERGLKRLKESLAEVNA